MEQSGPSRHLSQPAPPTLVVWKCVSCDTENQGPLELGCAICGAGKPGTKAPTTVQSTSTLSTSTGQDSVDRVCAEWLASQVDPSYLSAFKAGMEYQKHLQEPPQVADTSPVPILPLAGSITSRTLAAALGLFIDNILIHGPDEVKDGTWLSAEEARGVLAKLEETDNG